MCNPMVQNERKENADKQTGIRNKLLELGL